MGQLQSIHLPLQTCFASIDVRHSSAWVYVILALTSAVDQGEVYSHVTPRGPLMPFLSPPLSVRLSTDHHNRFLRTQSPRPLNLHLADKIQLHTSRLPPRHKLCTEDGTLLRMAGQHKTKTEATAQVDAQMQDSNNAATAKTEGEADTLAKLQALASSPYDEQLHRDNIRASITLEEKDEARTFMQSVLPLPEELWLEWISDKKSAQAGSSIDRDIEVLELYKQACGDYLCEPHDFVLPWPLLLPPAALAPTI